LTRVASNRVGIIVKVGVIVGVTVNVGNIVCVGTGLRNTSVGEVDVQLTINNNKINLRTWWVIVFFSCSAWGWDYSLVRELPKP